MAGCGDQGLLAKPLSAFFASRACPAAAIRAAMEWAIACAQEQIPVIGGFHTPLERSVLTVLLKAASPLVVVLPRPVTTAHLPHEWKLALNAGHLTVVSRVVRRARLSSEAAMHRNDTVARLADTIFIAHAEPGGQLAHQLDAWRQAGAQVKTVASS